PLCWAPLGLGGGSSPPWRGAATAGSCSLPFPVPTSVLFAPRLQPSSTSLSRSSCPAVMPRIIPRGDATRGEFLPVASEAHASRVRRCSGGHGACYRSAPMSRDDVSDDTIVVHDARLPEVAYPFVINVVEGPSRGERLAIDPAHPSRLLVGSSRTCDLTLGDPAVSRRHLALEVDGKKLRLRHLGPST